MFQRIRAHFDGKVIVPDEPVNLPANQPLEVELKLVAPDDTASTPARRQQALERLLSRAIHGLNIPPEALRRENLYEDPR